MRVFGSVFFEQGTDRVVRANFFQVHHRGLNVTLVDRSAIALFWNIALGLRQQVQKRCGHIFGEKLPGQLQSPAGILNYLDSFYSGNLVKEPSTAGVHQHQVALQFEQLQPADDFFL